jgi:hypothetical protein
MLLGVPGGIFKLEEKTFTFRILSNMQIENCSFTQESIQSIFEPLMLAGSYFLHLKEFVEYFLSTSLQQGMII